MSPTTMCDQPQPIETRVKHSLHELGFEQIVVTDLGDGLIKLTGPLPSPNDRAIVLAAARTVAGVTAVNCDFNK